MMKRLYVCLGVAFLATSAFAGVFVTSPNNGDTVQSPVHFVATSNTSCAKGVSAMGIYTKPGQLDYVVNGAKLDTNLTMAAGSYDTVVQMWDNCGGGAAKTVSITVGTGGGGGGTTMKGLHNKVGWAGYALLPPKYLICNSCKKTGPEETWNMTQNIASPSVSGASAQFDIGGNTNYADVLYNNHLIGALSSQGVPDPNHTLVPSLQHFTYDVYFFGKNLEKSQALEFDINQFFNSMGFIWGHECRIAGGHEWDTWDNVNKHWVDTNVPCNPVSNSWNHLIIQVSRDDNNQLIFESITLNGNTHNLNITRPHGTAAADWWGVTINWQYDGNLNQDPYTVYLDKLNFTYQ